MAASNKISDRVTAEQIERARSVNLVAFLHQYQPGELKRVGLSWTLRSHDSMRISADGKWNWFSQSVGGGDAISYLQKVHGMTFQESIRTLAGEDYQALQAEEAAREPPPARNLSCRLRTGIAGARLPICVRAALIRRSSTTA